MKSRITTLLILFGLLMAMPALALDLHSARNAGMVGEKVDGYAQALNATPDVQALVADVNAKRQQEYARISKENGQPIDVVAKLAAQQIVTNLGAGASYQTSDGAWKKK
ncbi:MAG TPA: DUF1318 domain-containing protein [Rhodospirillaceae bacterium]|nr:DUF1318 domain-containing protein [Rhodospirillaceae bacterium]